MVDKRTTLLTLEEVAEVMKMPRHAVERVERRAMSKIIDKCLADPHIISIYGGDLSSVAQALCQELNISLSQFVKYASPFIIKRYWTL